MVQLYDTQKAFENAGEYIDELLKVRQKYLDLVQVAFDSNTIMRTALDQACSSFINSNRRLAELLARYAHHLMDSSHGYMGRMARRRGRSRLNDTETETKIENVGVLFCLLEDKDVFKKFYAKLLAKRLIRGKCFGIMAEFSYGIYSVVSV